MAFVPMTAVGGSASSGSCGKQEMGVRDEGGEVGDTNAQTATHSQETRQVYRMAGSPPHSPEAIGISGEQAASALGD